MLIGNPTLIDLSPESIRKKFVCQDHFSAEFYNSSHRLTYDAIPLPYKTDENSISPKHIHVLTPTKTYSRRPTCQRKRKLDFGETSTVEHTNKGISDLDEIRFLTPEKNYSKSSPLDGVDSSSTDEKWLMHVMDFPTPKKKRLLPNSIVSEGSTVAMTNIKKKT